MFARLFLTLLLLACSQVAQAEEWKPLFNGKDIKGWTPKIRGHKMGVNFADTFRVEDGVLKVRFDKYEGRYRGRYGHLFYDKPFSHYRVRVECRSVGGQPEGSPGWARRNNGLMIFAQSPKSMVLDQTFPVSIEVQFLAGLDDGKPRPTANLCTPGTHVEMNDKLHKDHCTNSTSPTIKHGEWATIEVEVLGADRVRHFVNGKQVMEYRRPVLDKEDQYAKQVLEAGGSEKLIGGYIAIQSESAPFDFRKIEIKELPNKQ